MRRSVRILLNNYQVVEKKTSSLSLQEMYVLADKEEKQLINMDIDSAFIAMDEANEELERRSNGYDYDMYASNKEYAHACDLDLAMWIDELVA